MDRFLVKKTTSQSAESTPSTSGTPATASSTGKKKKKPVGKESTVNSWKLDWIGTERSAQNILRMYCEACRDCPSQDAKRTRGAIHTDSFVEGTESIKKFSALRHRESQSHKAAYGEWN